VTGVAKDAVTVRVVVTQPKGAATLDLSESILGSEWDPVVVPATYRLATDLVVASAAQPVGVATAFATGAVGSGVTLDSLRPDLTQISFLTAGDGTPFAPFVVRPADAVQPDVVIGAARVASGVVGLHPFLTRLDDGDRETFFDLVAASPGFPFLVAAVSDALKYDPAGLSDPAKFPEVFTAADKAVRETLAVLQYALPKLDVVTDCGTFPVGAGLSIAAASDSRVAFVNPRHVFFGVETSGAEFATRAFLVPPRRGVLKVFPPGGADPGTECVLLRPGRNDFAADALAPGADWLSAGGRGTLANALYGVLQTVSLTVRVPLPVTTSDVVEVLIDDLVLSADTPGNDEFATGLTGIVGSGLTPDLWFQQLAGWLTEDGGTRWDELAHRIWQHWPGDGPVAVHAAGARFLRSFTLVLAVNDAAPFVYDVVRSVNEAPVTFCATATGGTPTLECEAEPFSFEPGFTALPVFAAIGETVTFDPSPSTFSVTPPALPQYTWTISDGAGAAPTVIANSSSSSAVAFQFTAPGFHNVVLDLAVGPSTQRVVRPVQIDVFQNLGFELGDGTHWTTESHTWDNPTPDSRPQHSLVVTPGADEIAPALNRVFRGSYSLRIEDSGSNAFISTASRTVRVPAGGAVVRFAWAAVLQDPAHLPHEQPYFDVHVTDLTTGDTLYSIHHYAGEAGFPWSDAPVLGWKYVPWQPVTLDLSTLGGHDVRISAIGADCSLGGHGGYVYLDAP
jgi:hypothetical protein